MAGVTEKSKGAGQQGRGGTEQPGQVAGEIRYGEDEGQSKQGLVCSGENVAGGRQAGPAQFWCRLHRQPSGQSQAQLCPQRGQGYPPRSWGLWVLSTSLSLWPLLWLPCTSGSGQHL